MKALMQMLDHVMRRTGGHHAHSRIPYVELL
jgi:hypothetical protein